MPSRSSHSPSPRLLPGEVPRLGLDRTGSRKSIAAGFTLLRGDNATFLVVGGATRLLEVRFLITPISLYDFGQPYNFLYS